MLNAAIRDEAEGRGAHIPFPTTAKRLEKALYSARFDADRIADFTVRISEFANPELRYFRQNLPDSIPLNNVDELNYLTHLLNSLDEQALVKFEAVYDAMFHKSLEVIGDNGYTQSFGEKDLGEMIDIVHNLDRFTHYEGAHSHAALAHNYINEVLPDAQERMGGFYKHFIRHFDFEAYGANLDKKVLRGRFSREGYVYGGKGFERDYHHNAEIPARVQIWRKAFGEFQPRAVQPEELARRIHAACREVPHYDALESVALAREVIPELKKARHPMWDDPNVEEILAFCLEVGDPAVEDTVAIIMTKENEEALRPLHNRVEKFIHFGGGDILRQLGQPPPPEARARIDLSTVPPALREDSAYLDKLAWAAHFQNTLDTLKPLMDTPLASWCERKGIVGYGLLSPYQQADAEAQYRFTYLNRIKTVYYHAEKAQPLALFEARQIAGERQDREKPSILQRLKDAAAEMDGQERPSPDRKREKPKDIDPR